ncbi:hypothetical protein BH09MYX1_BH09MYX1_39860 [soil metagenome]
MDETAIWKRSVAPKLLPPRTTPKQIADAAATAIATFVALDADGVGFEPWWNGPYRAALVLQTSRAASALDDRGTSSARMGRSAQERLPGFARALVAHDGTPAFVEQLPLRIAVTPVVDERGDTGLAPLDVLGLSLAERIASLVVVDLFGERGAFAARAELYRAMLHPRRTVTSRGMRRTLDDSAVSATESRPSKRVVGD